MKFAKLHRLKVLDLARAAGTGIDRGSKIVRMAGITPDIEYTGIEELIEFFRQFAVGGENQQTLLHQGLRAAGRVAEGGTDNPGLAEMADLTMAAIAKLLQSPDPADQILALKLSAPVYEEAGKIKQAATELLEFYQRVGFTPGQD